MTEDNVVLGYAQALYELASESGQIEQIEKELQTMDTLLKESTVLKKLMLHPGVPVNLKKRLVESVLAHECSHLMKKFLYVLIDKRRERLLGFLFVSYRNVVRKIKGIVITEVQSAIQLTDNHLERLKTRLEKILGKEIEITAVINPEILGGLIIRFGDKLIDGSVRHKLSKLKKKLMQTVPA